MSTNPYNLPHKVLRPYQEESILWANDWTNLADGTIKITEQSTGSGKSAIAMAQSYNTSGKVVVLTKSKNLQQQYGKLFDDCAVLFGRSNYECIHPDNIQFATANDCLYDNRSECEFYKECPYVIAKNRALNAQRVTLNYAYWLTTYTTWHPNYLVLDEAHNLSDIILDWVGTTINADEAKKWGLPEFPVIATGIKSMFSRAAIEPSTQALGWLHGAVDAVSARIRVLEMRNLNEQVMREKRAATNLRNKLNNTIDALNLNPGDHWYIRSGPNVSWRGAGFVCRPLTARIDTSRFFFEQEHVLAMSATIGNVEAFANELGIKSYDFRVVPNQWEANARAIDILPVPSMGHAATEKNPLAWDKQADEIAKAIKSLPKTWGGLVLVTRKKEAILIADRLAKRGLQDRIWVMPGADGTYVPTQIQVEQWNARLKRWPNSICVSHSLWEGYDGVDEQFVICAKVPFPMILDEYERERMNYNPQFFLQRTAYILEQGAGRCRRGDPSDYNTDGQFNTYVAIADGSWKRVEKYLSSSMREAIRIN